MRATAASAATAAASQVAVSHVDMLYAWAVIVWLLGVVGWLLCRLWMCVRRRDAIEERRRASRTRA